MIFESLILENFRTYKGPEKINFARGDKNVTIIQGNNEVGKTTIMNAISWCLYGVEFYKDDGMEDVWSKSSSYEMEKGETRIVKVELKMTKSKKEVNCIRTLEFYKNDLGECKSGGSEFEILVDEMPVSRKDTFLSKHLPKNFREYFLFDGEQLEKYFKNNNASNSKNIKSSVYKLSHLNLLENILKHLKVREKEFISELEVLNPSLSKALKKLNKLKDSKNEMENKLTNLENDLSDWKKEKKEIEDTIITYGTDAKSLIIKKRELENAINSIDKDIEVKSEEYRLFLTKNFTKILSFNSLLNVKSICKELEEKGFIPANYKKEFLKYLIWDKQECICGTPLLKGSKEYNKMVEIYDKTPDTVDISDDVNKLLGSVNNIISNFPSDFHDSLVNKQKILNDLDEDRTSKSLDLTNLKNLLSDDDEKKVQKLLNRLEILDEFIGDGRENRGKYKEQISILDEKITIAKKEVADEEGKSGEKTDLESSRDFCNLVYGKIDSIYKELKNEIHTNLENLTSESFKNLHWKNFYEGVSIDNEYNVLIHKKNSDLSPNDLSKGGQLVLALSFMTALNSLSGFELPIIIDTPLARLDEDIKVNVAENLPTYAKNKQITLLVTGSEYSDEVKKHIRDHVGKEYELNYIQENDGITEIIEK